MLLARVARGSLKKTAEISFERVRFRSSEGSVKVIAMDKLLELPEGENSLMVAYQAVIDGSDIFDLENVADVYRQHFVPAVPPVSVQPPVFERVSLVDPTIRTIVRASTATL